MTVTRLSCFRAKNFIRFSIISLLITAAIGVATAAIPRDGFFYGMELEPVGDAAISTAELEPAVVLVFAADQKTATVTRQFDNWYADPDRPKVNVFAIAVKPAGMSDVVLLEALNQRKLQMPVFVSQHDILLGDDFRLLVLNDDQEIHRFNTLDVDGVYAALEKLGVTTESGPVSPGVSTTTTVVQNDVSDSVTTVSVNEDAGVLPDGTRYQTVTTTTRTRTPIVMGGGPGEQVYRNDLFGMTVEFPPNWRYRIAANEDGAVALEPPGSRVDMRIWALPADDIQTPQQYVDRYLESFARENSTRVNLERRFVAESRGNHGLDVTFNYTRPINPNNPAAGGLLHRGRLQVFVHDGYVKAASTTAPSAQFSGLWPMIESFFRSFHVKPGHINVSPGNGRQDLI